MIDIEASLILSKKRLDDLKDTLHPGKSIPFKQVGLLNTARRKEKILASNITVLNIAKEFIRKNGRPLSEAEEKGILGLLK